MSINSNENKNDKKDMLRFALFLGELMMSNGSETSRVEDTIIRVCKSRGFNHVSVFTSPTSLIISDSRFDGLTFMTTIKDRLIDLNKIDLFNDFSRKFVSNPNITLEDAIKELKHINRNSHKYSDYITYIAVGLSSASFGAMVGGNSLIYLTLTFLISIFSFIIYKQIINLSSIGAFASLVASSLIGFLSILVTHLGILDSPTTLIIGSIMPLLSGVSFVKGIRDLICGDLLSGLARVIDACLATIATAAGVGFMLDFWLRLGGTL